MNRAIYLWWRAPLQKKVLYNPETNYPPQPRKTEADEYVVRQITAELPAGTRPDRWYSLSCNFDSKMAKLHPITLHSKLTFANLQICWTDVQSGEARGRWLWTSSSAAHHRGGRLQEEEAGERGGEVRFDEVPCFDLNFSTLGWPEKLLRATRRIYQSSTIWWRSYLFTMNRERSIGTSSSGRDNEPFFAFWLLKIIKYSVMICRLRAWEFYTGSFFLLGPPWGVGQ